ncbi:MAG: hypothetical protein L6R39_007374 [Caloplaca ligustica]|nr:MAG: hypothetical protein L6R39_007374 [Caloplaca ligustica]
MCFGPCIKYSQCGHHKHSIESPCHHGVNANGECKKGSFGITRNRRSTTPSLCVNCYRRHVDDVIARYKQKIQDLDGSIKYLTEAMNMRNLPGRKRWLEETVSEQEVERGELIDKRYEELEEFRIQQGVWGDGGPYKGYRPFGTQSAVE